MNNHFATDISGLDVYLQEQKIGRLWLDEKRRFVFQYDAEWIGQRTAVPLSLSLPLQAEAYPDDLARPFFSNLLPEAGIRRVIAQHLRISEKNDFAMLNSIGGECAGAVSVLPCPFLRFDLHSGLSGLDGKTGHENRWGKQTVMDPAEALGTFWGSHRNQA
jgi:serine/threonine-protein kinase HipA